MTFFKYHLQQFPLNNGWILQTYPPWKLWIWQALIRPIMEMWPAWQPVHFCVVLTHWGRVTHICVSKLTIIGSDNGLSPDHYLKQCWNIVSWTHRNKLQWNFDWNLYIFIQEYAFESVVWKMAAILCRPKCVKHQEGVMQEDNSLHKNIMVIKLQVGTGSPLIANMIFW